MVRTKQGGSVLSFVVVGVLLLAVFAGGAYAVRQYMQPAQEMPAELPGGQPQEKTSPEEKAPAPESQSDETPQKQEDKPQENKPQADTSPEPTQPSKNQNDSATLPQTGPSQLIASLFAVGLLSVTAVSYLRSRRLQLPL